MNWTKGLIFTVAYILGTLVLCGFAAVLGMVQGHRRRARRLRDGKPPSRQTTPLRTPPAPARGWLDDVADEQNKKRATEARREAHYRTTSEYFHPVVERLLSEVAAAYWGAGTGWTVRSLGPRSGYWTAEKGSYRFTVMLSSHTTPPEFVVFAKGGDQISAPTTDNALKIALREACRRGPKLEIDEDPQEALAKKIARAMKAES